MTRMPRERSHSMERALERYSLEYKGLQRRNMLAKINSNEAVLLRKGAGHTFAINYQDRPYLVTYDRSKEEITTFLPERNLSRLLRINQDWALALAGIRKNAVVGAVSFVYARISNPEMRVKELGIPFRDAFTRVLELQDLQLLFALQHVLAHRPAMVMNYLRMCSMESWKAMWRARTGNEMLLSWICSWDEVHVAGVLRGPPRAPCPGIDTRLK